jgi:hypothetical protein
MNTHKVIIRSGISCFGPAISTILLVNIIMAGTAFSAGSPFELEIGDLEKTTVRQPAVKAKGKKKLQARKKSARKRPATMQPIPVEQEGEYLKYTIRPGDHIYKVLTSRFGLSSAEAEGLMPTILRINGISNIAGLQIGQVILIPAAEIKTGKPDTAQPATAGPTGTVAAIAEKQKLPVEKGLIERIRNLWTSLFPERGPAAGTLREKIVGNTAYPVLTGADNGEILITREGMPPVFGNVSGAQASRSEKVVALPADGGDFAGPLLKGAGFEKVDENTPVTFGTDPRITVMPDYAVVKRIPGTETRERILLFTGGKGCPSQPEAMTAFLAGMGFRLVTLCDRAPEKLSAENGRVLPLVATDPEKLIDSMLDALALKWSKSHPVEMVLDQKEGYSIGVNVDRYFEEQGERYFVDFGRQEKEHETLMRLVELAGYRRIAVDRNAGPAAIAEKFLKALQLSSEFRKRVFTSLPDGRITVETTCFLFSGRSAPAKLILAPDPPLDKSVCDLLTAGLWSAK